METMQDNLIFQPHAAGYCERCGKYRDEMYLVTLSSGGQTDSMTMCPECAMRLKTRVDRHNARAAAPQTPAPQTPAPQAQPVRYAPPVRAQTAQMQPAGGKQRKKTIKAPVLAAAAIVVVAAVVIGAVFGGRAVRKDGTVKTSGGKSGAIAASSSHDGWIIGDILNFGAYPQTEVLGWDDWKGMDFNNEEDRKAYEEQYEMRKKLEERAKNWHSYGYYSGSVSADQAKVDVSSADADFNSIEMHPSDYMEYCDVTLDGETYRGVRFKKYRPFSTIYEAGEDPDIGRQVKNSYLVSPDNQSDAPLDFYIYWFRWEPLRWHVIDRDRGLLVCESIIDAQPFNNVVFFESGGVQENGHTILNAYSNADKTVYANNYAESSIRQWLTHDFYDTAFSAGQKTKLLTTTLNNDSGATLFGNSGCEQFDAPETQDKVFLLSASDLEPFVMQCYLEAEQNSPYPLYYCGAASSYAKCQGLFSRFSGEEYPWFLRSAGLDSPFASIFEHDARADDYFCNVTYTNGVRPAICLDLQSASLPQIGLD